MVILETFSKAQPFDEIFDRKEPSFVKVTTSADGKPHFQIKVMQIKAAICKVGSFGYFIAVDFVFSQSLE